MKRFVRFTGFCLSLLLCFPLGAAAADPLGQSSRIAQAPGRKADSASFSRLSAGAKTLAGAKMLHPGFAFAHGKLQNRIPGRNAASESALSAGQKRDVFMRSVRLSREMIKTGSSVASLFSAASAAFSAVRSSGDSLFTVSGSVVTGLTEEGKNYFRDHHRLEVPSGITAVGDEAFKSLGLTEAVLPPSVTAVGDRAFYDNALTAPDLSSLRKIGKSAFQKNKLRGALVLKNIESLGESAFADNELTSLEIKEERQITDTAARLTEVPANAFRDNRLTGVSLPDTVTVLGDACFANNDLGDFSFRRGLVTVGDAVFSGNHFSQAAFPDTLRNFGRDVFANNKRWIKIDPSSPAAVKNAKYSTGFGNVRNSVSLQISYVDENGVDIVSPRVMDSEFFDPNGVYYKDSENTMDVPRFAGFTAQGATGATLRGDKLYFTPDRDKYVLKIRYRRENVLPYINGEFNKRFAVGEKIDRAALLKGMYAYDTKGQSISVTVFPDEIKDPKQNTVYDVWYRATDERGNTAVTPGKILVGMDWPQMPICTGWKVKDFTYDNDGKITGFNPQGNHAHATEIPCWPSVDTYGRRVSGIGRFAFSGKGLTKIPSDWGEIRYIDYYAFNGNKLVALPASWGKVVDVSSYAFSNNKLRSLPPSWGEISSIDSGSFEHNEIGSLPLSWGKVGSVSEDAFANNKISSIPDSWGRISYLQNGAFAHNRIRKIPPSWGEITAAGEETRRNSRYGVFQDNEIEEIPPSWEKVKELGLSAFSGNKIGRIPSSWGKIDELPSYVFSNNRVREIPGSWGEITEIGESAFSGNKISVLPDTWNKITEIKSSAFSGNQIENLPGSWENVGKIGGYAFNGNKIAILPPVWGKITEIDSGTFGSNKIRKIPDSWGEITAVRGGAFKNNPLDTVPQTWGKINYLGSEAFWETNVTSIPDSWGEITEINRRLFGVGLSSLPLSWGKATKIDDEAFVGYKLTKIPSDWGEITQIGWRAFEENNIAALPASWGKVNYIGWYAFKSNQISTFPDSWGEITQIGKQTFYGNKIPSVPQSWGKVTKIEEEAFKDNKIADFARDWGSVTEIGKSAFESNLIPALPASWGKVAKFGEEAFYGNKIEKIPSNWGEITELPLFVFGSNRITEIPSDWGKITTIAQQPFSGSKITNIPDSWGKITSLFTDYFLEGCPVKKLPLSWGKLKPHSGFDYIFGADSGVDPGVRKNISLAFEEDDEDVEAVAKMLERQYAFYLGRPAYIHPKSGVRPAGVEDTEYMKIIEGPVNATITVRYTDSAGKKLRPDETLVYDLRKLMKYNEDNGLDPNNKIVSPSPAAIPGYRMPAKQRVRVDGAAHEVTFVYTPLSAAELNKGRLTLNGTVTDALVNSELETELAFDSAQSLGDGSINVNFDPRYVSYVRGSGSSFIEKEQVIAPGVLHIKLKPINTGTKIVFYLRWKLAPRITPSGKNFPVSAVLLDGDNPLLKTKTVNLRGYYNLPTFEKKVRKDVYGYVGDFDSDPGGEHTFPKQA